MNQRERAAHGLVVECVNLVATGDALRFEVHELVCAELRRFRPRCHLCRRVLAKPPWVDRARLWECRCGWRTWEAAL